MYSTRVIQANLAEFSRLNGWEPTPHSLEEIKKFSAHIDSITEVQRNARSTKVSLTRELTKQHADSIRRFIENEQILCALDAGYWINNYAYICDARGEVIKFIPREGQKVFAKLLAQFEEDQISIEMLILKARQIGITSATVMYFVHRLLFIPHTQAVMASVQQEKSELIQRITTICLDRLPWWLAPSRTRDNQKLVAFDNGSVISIQSGSQATGIAQGWTPTCLVPGSPIRLSNGSVKAIEEVIPGDEVITHTGQIVPVINSFETFRERKETKKIKLWGESASLECTPDHRVYGKNGWRTAESISAGDYLHYPVRFIKDRLKYGTAYQMDRGSVREYRKIEFQFPLDFDMGYLCGFYLAEGNIHYSAMGHKTKTPYPSELNLAIHEREIERSLRAIRAVFGNDKKIRVKRREGEHGAHLTFSCAWLARWLSQNFGEGCARKYVPDWVWNCSRDFCKGLLNGYVDGDGHLERTNNNVVTVSISLPLILQMRDLAASLGLGWSSVYRRELHRDHKCWALIMSGPTGAAYRSMFGFSGKKPKNGKSRYWYYSPTKESIWIKVKSVAESTSDRFFDLEIAHEDHSFLTQYFSVHNCVHLSEIGDVPNPKKTIEEGLLRATHSSRKLFMVLEGTGNGNTGWQADTWRAAKEDYPKGRHRLCPVFIPWPMASDLYPEKDWLRKFPVPDGWEAKRETRNHVRKCELYIRNTDYLVRIAGADWKMPREQQWFWEFNYDQAVKSHTEKVWMSQMPADDREALVGQNDLVFDESTIEVISENRKRNYQAYGVMGETIDEGLEPAESDIDYNKERIKVNWTSNRGTKFEWQLVPLLPFDESKDEESFGKILVFEEPKDGQDYTFGIDTADGLGKPDEDRSVLSGTHSVSGDNCDNQVFELCSNRINPPQMVGFAACLGAWYGKHSRDPRGVKFCIEQRMRPGDDCQLQLKLMGFTFFHRMILYDNRQVKEQNSNKEGWFTTNWSRSFMLNKFVEAVRGGWYQPHSPGLIREIAAFERKITATGRTKLEGQSGKKDDRVLGAALSYISRHHLEVLAERQQKRYQVPTGKLPQLTYEHATHNAMSVGEM